MYVPSDSWQSVVASAPFVVPPSVCGVVTAQRFGCAVAVNVTGGRPAAVAVSVLVPSEPRVQLPTFAMPKVFVVVAPPVTDPPPVATANVTATPAVGFPLASLTVTDGATETTCDSE